MAKEIVAKKRHVLTDVWEMFYNGVTDKEKIADKTGASSATVNTEGNYYRRARMFFLTHNVKEGAEGKAPRVKKEKAEKPAKKAKAKNYKKNEETE